MIRYYGVFEPILKHYIKDISRVLKLDELLGDDYLSVVKLIIGPKSIPMYGSANIAKQPFCIAYINETNRQEAVTFNDNQFFVILATCNSLKQNVFMIAHELKHIEQLASKRLDTDYNWEGINCRNLVETYHTVSDYMALPWEKDANEFARQYISSKKLPESVDFQDKEMLYTKYKTIHEILRYIDES